MSAKNHSTKSMKNFDHLDAMRYALKLPENQYLIGTLVVWLNVILNELRN